MEKLKEILPIKRKLHIQFFKHFLNNLPSCLADQECNRMTIAYFSLNGIDMLNGLNTLQPDFKQEIIEWIYTLQVLPGSGDEDDEEERICGFMGSSNIKNTDKSYECGHLAMTYTALCCLLILGDDLSRVNKEAVIDGVRKLQKSNGSFYATKDSEADMRFIYCAACISYILNDFRGIDLDRMVKYILDSINYDGGLGQGPGLESHGGSTFCGVAALHLTHTQGALSPTQVERIKRWCVMRQQEGFQGRPNKPEDTCYSFWVGGTLALLNSASLVDAPSIYSFVLSTADPIRGGFGKLPDSQPDFLHGCLGLVGLGILGDKDIAPVFPLLCITKRAHSFLQTLHQKW